MPTILPARNNAFTAMATIERDNTLKLSGSVSDNEIRKLGLKHDGFEKVDAYIPTANGGAWQKVELKFEMSVASGPTPARDLYDVSVKLTEEQADAVRRDGVAFGIRLNQGEQLWAQEPGKNLRAHDNR